MCLISMVSWLSGAYWCLNHVDALIVLNEAVEVFTHNTVMTTDLVGFDFTFAKVLCNGREWEVQHGSNILWAERYHFIPFYPMFLLLSRRSCLILC